MVYGFEWRPERQGKWSDSCVKDNNECAADEGGEAKWSAIRRALEEGCRQAGGSAVFPREPQEPTGVLATTTLSRRYWGGGEGAEFTGHQLHWAMHRSPSPAAPDVFNQELNKTREAGRWAHERIVAKHWRFLVKPAGRGEKGTKAGGGCWALVHTRLPVLSPQPPARCSVVGTAST